MSKKVTTPAAVLSYPHFAEPTAMKNDKGEDGTPKYSGSFVFLEGTDITALEKAVEEVAIEAFGPSAVQKLKTGALHSPFRRDGEAKGYPAGSVFINARSEQQPGLVYPHRAADGRPAPVEQDDIEKVFYPGAIVRAVLQAYSFVAPNNTKKGVTFGLGHVQKIKDGERLDGRLSAQDEFEALTDLEPASLEDLNA